MAGQGTLDNLDDSFALTVPSPESLRQQSLSYPQVTDHENGNGAYHDPSTDSDEDAFEPHDVTLRQRQSTASSISSFPASILHHDIYHDRPEFGVRTPSKSQSVRNYQNERVGSPTYGRLSQNRNHIAGFRNPSSVRMQMYESEYDEMDAVTPNSRRREPRMFSHRSSNSLYSTPTKRSSRSNTPHKHHNSVSKLKKEFPLVLLHCTLLKPAVASRGPLVSDDILEAVLPEEYRKRWRTLQDKIIKNPEVHQRGVLIPHPRDDYELLEERLLESLELERPRIRQNHYLGSKDPDSGFESSSSQADSVSSDNEDDQGILGQKCPDCGKHVTLTQVEQERKWEVKVYAANGLMKGGAWAAAWSEMEKVDVEVGVWMPEDVRREVEARLAALQQRQEEIEAEAKFQEEHPQLRSQKKISNERKRPSGHRDERMKEIYGATISDSTGQRNQDEIDGLDDLYCEQNGAHLATPRYSRYSDVRDFATSPATPPFDHRPASSAHGQAFQQELRVLIQRRLETMLHDQRNIAIVFLGVLVLFFAISSSHTPLIESALPMPSTSLTPSSSIAAVPNVLKIPISHSSAPLFSTTNGDNTIARAEGFTSSSLTSSESPTSHLESIPSIGMPTIEEDMKGTTTVSVSNIVSDLDIPTTITVGNEQAEATTLPALLPPSEALEEQLFSSIKLGASVMDDDSLQIDDAEPDGR